MMEDTGVRRGPRVPRRSFADVSFDRAIRKGARFPDESLNYLADVVYIFTGAARRSWHPALVRLETREPI